MRFKPYDQQYIELCHNILNNGIWDKPENVRTKYADSTPATTVSLLNQTIQFDNSIDSALLTSKRVATKDPIKEILWIWQKMSNNVDELNEMGCHVWDEWKLKDGTIGRAYAWQLKNKKRKVKVDDLLVSMIKEGKFSFTIDDLMTDFMFEVCVWNDGELEYVRLNQVDWLLYQLKKNPYSRRLRTTLWGVDDLDEMALEPCVHSTQWQMWDDKLHLTVDIRGNDVVLGNPYNVYQYSVLHKMIAQVSELEVGNITFNINNAHIYDRHVDTLQEQLKGELHKQPTVTINPEVTSFYGFTVDDVTVTNYTNNGKFKYEVAI